jgi:hypothetical protein
MPRWLHHARLEGGTGASAPLTRTAKYPDPSPCIAKEKSASPSYRASTSLPRQKSRESNTGRVAATTLRSHPASPYARTRPRQVASISPWSTDAKCRAAHVLRSCANSRWVSSKNGQSRYDASAIVSRPRTPGFAFAQRLRMHAQSLSSPCTLPGLAPRSRLHRESTSTIRRAVRVW